jgi:nitrate/nitrite transporter NarK
LRKIKEALLTFFEVVAYGALLLLLPCVVAGLIFDSILSDILAQIMLVAVAGTVILTAIAIYEEWYPEHLSGWGAHPQSRRA